MRSVIVLLPLALVAGCDRQAQPAPQAGDGAAVAPAPRVEATGSLDISRRGAAMPGASFTGADGARTTLAAFTGRPVLVNLWATWCGPCVTEMPSLDRLAVRSAGRLTVLAISQDLQGRETVDPWWATRGFTALKPWFDPDNGLSTAIGGGMLPTTILYGADGKEIWRVTGAMDWDGPRANTLLAEFTQPSGTAS